MLPKKSTIAETAVKVGQEQYQRHPANYEFHHTRRDWPELKWPKNAPIPAPIRGKKPYSVIFEEKFDSKARTKNGELAKTHEIDPLK